MTPSIEAGESETAVRCSVAVWVNGQQVVAVVLTELLEMDCYSL